MKQHYLLLTLGVCASLGPTALAQTPTTVQSSAPKQAQSLYASEIIALLDGFSSTTQGFEATIVRAPVQVGAWSGVINWPFIAIHTHVLPTGLVLAWQGHNDQVWNESTDPQLRGTKVYVWDPVNQFLNMQVYTGSNLFCAGHSFLRDGKLLTAGGHSHTTNAGDILGLNHSDLYDASGNTWQPQSGMSRVRWYPTNTTLASGEVLTTSGETEPNLQPGMKWPEVWSSGNNNAGNGNGSWRKLENAPLALPLYPWMFAAPNGKVFYAGPGPVQDNRYLNPYAVNSTTLKEGEWEAPFSAAAAGQPTWNGTPYLRSRYEGSAVMYAPGKLLLIGGEDSRTVTNSAQLIDITGGTPQYLTAAPMAYPRHHVNTTVLPDGTVLVTGGSRVSGSNNRAQGVLPAEIWTPPTTGLPGGSWTTVASMQEARLYHSTAVLLPDGRVLSAGGEEVIRTPYQAGVDNHPNAEIYSPPYLFKGARPYVSYAPLAVNYGQSFTVRTSNASSIAKVTWIRLPSVTHSFNMNQRFLSLPFTIGAGQLTVSAPSVANDCPPGHYMLFAVDQNGVPSEAKIISISTGTCTASLALASSLTTTSSCSADATVTASGSNLSSDYRWFIDGVYEPGFDGQSAATVILDVCRPTATVEVEVTPVCGGASVVATRSVFRSFRNCPACRR